MNEAPTERQHRKLELAARAAWLYYIAGQTQDQIAATLSVSRQAAQRLVALAASEHLIKFRVDHPIVECVALGERLRERYRLEWCDVVPEDPENPGDVRMLAVGAAERLEGLLLQTEPAIFAFGTGRTPRAVAAQVSPMAREQHRLVSLVGTMNRDGRASPYEVIMRLAERTGAQCYPLPAPVVTDTVEARIALQAQRPHRMVTQLASQASAVFAGIGQIDRAAPMARDGFITEAEVAELMERGAVGEICGWPFDRGGAPVVSPLTERLCAVPLTTLPPRTLIGVAAGANRVPAIAAALHGGLLAALVTDEATARLLLDRSEP
ncbi:MAG TPA: sugar-binding transcriptional regulator [Alphaproteobacteria bacterium]|nr:sugar-binding transcriptional regulator [Alphaproteobacteria bacterium]